MSDRPSQASARRKAAKRWWRRKPINRLLVWLHRWPALILGVLLVVETTSGAIVLYNADYFRATHGSFYHRTSSATAVSPDQAVTAVQQAHPSFDAAWLSLDKGVIVVGNTDYTQGYAVDPSTGAINGSADLNGGPMGFLVNLHDCAFTCAGSPGYQAWLTEPFWSGGPSAVAEITWGGLILGVLGCLMILLFFSGLKIWWPRTRDLGRRFYAVRRGKGRFARDYDLHNVIAAWSMPFVLMWGVTGAAFEFPVVKDAWLAITGGDKADPDAYTFTTVASKAEVRSRTPVDYAQATSTALDRVPGEVRYVELATADVPYWSVAIKTSYGPYRHRIFYSGDTYVFVDAYDPTHTKITGGRSESNANSFYDYTLEASHFGWNVNGWWRLLWVGFGLAPLALLVTGISTWLFRRGVKKRRRSAIRARDPQITPVDDLDAELIDGHLDDLDPALVHADDT